MPSFWNDLLVVLSLLRGCRLLKLQVCLRKCVLLISLPPKHFIFRYLRRAYSLRGRELRGFPRNSEFHWILVEKEKTHEKVEPNQKSMTPSIIFTITKKSMKKCHIDLINIYINCSFKLAVKSFEFLASLPKKVSPLK